MTRKQKRLAIIGGLGTAVVVAMLFIAWGFQSTFSFFVTPSELDTADIAPGRALRLGGLVREGTWIKQGEVNTFVVADADAEVTVSFVGILPDLFREGQGVIAEGSLTENGGFAATNVLAKHDENYIPREIQEELAAMDEWHPDYGSEESGS
jgi:cytochrome c-type biogenesis protein CcmE